MTVMFAQIFKKQEHTIVVYVKANLENQDIKKRKVNLDKIYYFKWQTRFLLESGRDNESGLDLLFQY